MNSAQIQTHKSETTEETMLLMASTIAALAQEQYSPTGERKLMELLTLILRLDATNTRTSVIRELGSTLNLALASDLVQNGAMLVALDITRNFLRESYREAFRAEQESVTVIIDAAQQPPKFAEYLLYFLPKDQCEPLLGDCEEVYRILCKDQGKRRAQFWYWCQVIMALQSLWSNKIFKRLATWAALTGVGQMLSRVIPWEWLRRYLPLDEWIRRIIS